jgi:hypothetical protein
MQARLGECPTLTQDVGKHPVAALAPERRKGILEDGLIAKTHALYF